MGRNTTKLTNMSTQSLFIAGPSQMMPVWRGWGTKQKGRATGTRTLSSRAAVKRDSYSGLTKIKELSPMVLIIRTGLRSATVSASTGSVTTPASIHPMR